VHGNVCLWVQNAHCTLGLVCMGGGTLQALYVLEAMHNSGLRHRDIRPDNLLFLNGTVMVIDFAYGCRNEAVPYVAEALVPLSLQ
jgi:serine/threonine protein kinase